MQEFRTVLRTLKKGKRRGLVLLKFFLIAFTWGVFVGRHDPRRNIRKPECCDRARRWYEDHRSCCEHLPHR